MAAKKAVRKGTKTANLRAQDDVDGPSFRELIQEAVAFNQDHPPSRP